MTLDAAPIDPSPVVDIDAAGAPESVRAHVRRGLTRRDLALAETVTREVLVLHTRPQVLFALVTALSLADITAHGAATLAEARVVLRQRRPAVVVAHYHLDADTTALAWLRSLPRLTRALVVSADNAVDSLTQLARSANAGFLPTPLEPHEMDAFVERVVTLLEMP